MFYVTSHIVSRNEKRDRLKIHHLLFFFPSATYKRQDIFYPQTNTGIIHVNIYNIKHRKNRILCYIKLHYLYNSPIPDTIHTPVTFAAPIRSSILEFASREDVAETANTFLNLTFEFILNREFNIFSHTYRLRTTVR